MKAKYWAIIVLLALGVAKLPLEQRVSESLKQSGALSPPPDLGLRENLGQMSFAATLGGLRSLVASLTFLQGITAFENGDWPMLDSLMTVTTRMQPKVDFYWLTAADHMAFDAASAYRNDESRPGLYRRRLYRENVERGIDILTQGLKYNPDSASLEERLAYIYSMRVEPPDHRQAGNHYFQAFKNGALPYTQRFAAYEWAATDDIVLLNQAYDILRKEYQRMANKPRNQQIPRVAQELKNIERKIGMPALLR